MRSTFEKNIAKLLKKNKVKFDYEKHSFSYTLEYVYTPDFIIGDMYIEAKGYLRPRDRKLLLRIKETYPDLDLRLWFQKDGYLNNKTKATTYSKWAKRNGFKYHVGENLPKKWFKE